MRIRRIIGTCDADPSAGSGRQTHSSLKPSYFSHVQPRPDHERFSRIPDPHVGRVSKATTLSSMKIGLVVLRFTS